MAAAITAGSQKMDSQAKKLQSACFSYISGHTHREHAQLFERKKQKLDLNPLFLIT
jgi:hypothetical protein